VPSCAVFFGTSEICFGVGYILCTHRFLFPFVFVREHGVHAGPKDYFVVVVVVVVVICG
jgi:hypothetical protein